MFILYVFGPHPIFRRDDARLIRSLSLRVYKPVFDLNVNPNKSHAACTLSSKIELLQQIMPIFYTGISANDVKKHRFVKTYIDSRIAA